MTTVSRSSDLDGLFDPGGQGAGGRFPTRHREPGVPPGGRGSGRSRRWRPRARRSSTRSDDPPGRGRGRPRRRRAPCPDLPEQGAGDERSEHAAQGRHDLPGGLTAEGVGCLSQLHGPEMPPSSRRDAFDGTRRSGRHGQDVPPRRAQVRRNAVTAPTEAVRTTAISGRHRVGGPAAAEFPRPDRRPCSRAGDSRGTSAAIVGGAVGAAVGGPAGRGGGRSMPAVSGPEVRRSRGRWGSGETRRPSGRDDEHRLVGCFIELTSVESSPGDAPTCVPRRSHRSARSAGPNGGTMNDAVIVDAVRTPIGKGKPSGALAASTPSTCSPTPCAPSSSAPASTPPSSTTSSAAPSSQVGEQAMNIGRRARAGRRASPRRCPATTVDRQCGSSQQAIHFAAQGVIRARTTSSSPAGSSR